MNDFKINDVNRLQRIGSEPRGNIKRQQNNGLAFKQILDRQSQLKFSKHAIERIHQRGITMDSSLKAQLNQAVEKADRKGLKEIIVIGKQGTFIVNVKNRMVVTGVSTEETKNSVFTNIDGAVFL